MCLELSSADSPSIPTDDMCCLHYFVIMSVTLLFFYYNYRNLCASCKLISLDICNARKMSAKMAESEAVINLDHPFLFNHSVMKLSL